MLPVLKSPIFECKLPVINKTIKHRAYYTAEEKALLTSFNDPEKKKDQMNNLIAIMKNCLVEDSLNLESLSSIDFLYFGMMLRAKSKGEVIEMNLKCIKPECHKTFETSVDLETIIKFKNENKKKELVEIGPNFFVEIGPSKMQFLIESDQLSDKYKKSADDSVESLEDLQAIELIETNVKHCIYKIIDGDKIYDNFTLEELQESIISKMTEKQLVKVFNAKANLISMKIEFEVKCPHCGQIVKHEINDFFEFLL